MNSSVRTRTDREACPLDATPPYFQPFPTPHPTNGLLVVASTHQVKQEKVFQH